MTNSNALWRRTSIALAAVGLIVATYLTWLHFSDSQALCVAGGGCDTVRKSSYSEIATTGIPVALVGMCGYLTILGILTTEELAPRTLVDIGTLSVFGLSLLGALYSLYLTYLELFVIRALCPYCMASAILMLALLGIAICRLPKAYNA